VLGNVAIFAGLLFLPTRNLSWWRAWVFLGVVVVGAVASTVSVRRASRALLEERFKSPVQAGQPLARPNRFVSSAGLILFVAGWWVMSLALRANPFAAPAVKHQADRRQVAIDSGLYSLVRHPMYAGAIMLFVGMPLWLESYAATILAGIPAGLLVLRIHIEERFLRRELPGYDLYARRVRYRLIPRLW